MDNCRYLDAYVTNNIDTCQIRGSHSGFAEDSNLPGCDDTSLGVQLSIFRRSEAPSPSRSVSPRRFVGWVKLRLLHPEDDRNTILRNVVSYSSSDMTSDLRMAYAHECILVSPCASLREKCSPNAFTTTANNHDKSKHISGDGRVLLLVYYITHF